MLRRRGRVQVSTRMETSSWMVAVLWKAGPPTSSLLPRPVWKLLPGWWRCSGKLVLPPRPSYLVLYGNFFLDGGGALESWSSYLVLKIFSSGCVVFKRDLTIFSNLKVFLTEHESSGAFQKHVQCRICCP